jgi:hypothetical protein
VVRQPGAAAGTLGLPAFDLAQQRDHSPARSLPGVEADVVREEVGAGLGQPVEQRHELPKRAGGVAQAIGLE